MKSRLTINEAIELFGLDDADISISEVKSRFRQFAHKYHPDKYFNYKDKLKAQKEFICIQEAREILLGALASGVLPNKAGLQNTCSISESRSKWNATTAAASTTGSNAPSMSPRISLLVDPLIDHPILSIVLGWLLLPGIFFMLMGAGFYVWIFFIIYAVLGEKLRRRSESFFSCYWGLTRSIFLFPVYFVFGATTATVLGQENDFLFSFILVSSSITLLWLIIEEVYAGFKYYRNRSKFKIVPHRQFGK